MYHEIKKAIKTLYDLPMIYQHLSDRRLRFFHLVSATRSNSVSLTEKDLTHDFNIDILEYQVQSRTISSRVIAIKMRNMHQSL